MARKRKSSDGFNEKDYPGATGGPAGARKRYVGVRQRPSGRWVAEIKDTIQKIRVWLGTFDTAEAAARAYDEAACLLRGSNTRTNFWPCSPAHPSARPALPSKVSDLLLLQLKARREAQQQSQQHQEDEDIEQFQFSEFLNDLSVCEGAEQRKAEEEGVFDVGAMDMRFVDTGEGQCCFYSPFEIAEEIVEPMEQETVVADEHLMLKRMKYERKISASLYAINGISECLKVRFGGNRGVDHCNVSNLRSACERQGVKEEEMVGGEDGEGVQEQVENPQNPDPCLPSLSSSTSPSSSSWTSNSEGELSLWSSLDLPPICFVS